MKCYACDKRMKGMDAKRGAYAVAVKGEPAEYLYPVGADCFKKIKAAGVNGYQPPLGGPVLILQQYAAQHYEN